MNLPGVENPRVFAFVSSHADNFGGILTRILTWFAMPQNRMTAGGAGHA